ncbi:hypothetical protein GF326_06325, partial [Candidatus Bathyarchaeota archaeon]|nr:hypothetical protein [Candidatus Bathyarchaeota archaeon]
MTLRKELTDGDVRKIVKDSLQLVSRTQRKLDLPIMSNLLKTSKRLKQGNFKAIYINNPKGKNYSMDFGSFQPPDSIFLDKRLPSSDHPMHMPDFAETLTVYSAVHEIIHADDHIGGDKLLLATCRHILREHVDKLERSLQIIKKEGGHKVIKDYEDLASLWSIQYLDMVTHYKSYVVLRYMEYPKLDQIWSRLSQEYFPPNLLTCIEVSRGTDYIF